MYRQAVLIFTAIMTLSVSIASAGEHLRVAVNELDANGVSEQVAAVVSDHLRVKLIETRRFIIPEREKMEAILAEQAVGMQLGECYSQECAIEIGRLLQANKLVVGTVSLLNQTYNISVRFLDLETGAAEFSAEEKVQTLDDLFLAAERLAARIAAFVPPKGTVTAVSDGNFIINLGSADGVTTGMPFRIMRRVERVPGYPEDELIATVQTTAVQETWSRVAFQSEHATQNTRPRTVQVGDIALGPQTVVVNELPQYAYLTVFSRPIGAEVYVDNLFRGRTNDKGLEVRLKAGEHSVRLAAPAHEAEERVVALQPSQRMPYNATLEPVLPKGVFNLPLTNFTYVRQRPTSEKFRSLLDSGTLRGLQVGFGQVYSYWTSEIGASWTMGNMASGNSPGFNEVHRLAAYGQLGLAYPIGWFVPYGAMGYEFSQLNINEQDVFDSYERIGAAAKFENNGWYWTVGLYVRNWIQISYQITTGRSYTNVHTVGVGLNLSGL